MIGVRSGVGSKSWMLQGDRRCDGGYMDHSLTASLTQAWLCTAQSGLWDPLEWVRHDEITLGQFLFQFTQAARVQGESMMG